MPQFDLSSLKLSTLPRWIPLAASFLALVALFAMVVVTLIYVVGVLAEAGEPIDPQSVASRFPSVDEAALKRLEPRLAPVETE